MISVIIPCYNYGRFIADALKSLQQQTYRDIEVIVINDGSTDNTEAVVELFSSEDQRIRCYTYPNTGLGASRNRGLEIAKGDFIQFLDADDLLERQKMEMQAKLFAEHRDADIVYGSVRYFSHDPYDEGDRNFSYWGSRGEWMPKFEGAGQEFLLPALKGNFAHLSSMLFRRTIVDRVGLFENDISAVADYHFLLRCVFNNALFYYQDAKNTYSLVRWHPDNLSKDPNYMRKEEMIMRQRLIPLLQDNAEALLINENAMQALAIHIKGSWRKILLSGGPFDPVKKWLKLIGLEKITRRIFYK